MRVNGIRYTLFELKPDQYVAKLFPTKKHSKAAISKARLILSQREGVTGIIVDGESEWRSHGWRSRLKREEP